jgi:hypothetical protein
MSINEVRRYARQTATELLTAGIRKESLVDANGVEQLWGWPIWGQILHIEVYEGEFDRVGYGQSERSEIWLRTDGTLMEVQLVVDIWPGFPPDRVEKVTEASDHAIHWADVAYHQRCEPPTVPPGRYGQFVSAVTMRPGLKIPEPPGTVLLEGLKHLAETSRKGRTTQLCIQARDRAHKGIQAAVRRAEDSTATKSWKGKTRALSRWSLSLALVGVPPSLLAAYIANGPKGLSGKPGVTTSFLIAVLGWGIFQAAITISVASHAKSESELDDGLLIATVSGFISATTVSLLLGYLLGKVSIPSTAWLLTWVLVATIVGLLASRWALRASRS